MYLKLGLLALVLANCHVMCALGHSTTAKVAGVSSGGWLTGPKNGQTEPRSIVKVISKPNDEFQLELNEAACTDISNLGGGVHVVTVHGPYHGGKSFFLNALMNITRKQERFPVGSTTEPTTKGMSYYALGTDVGGGSMLMIDTEGMIATDTKVNYDAKMFALSALISDLILFNTMHHIDNAAMDLLEMLARQARLLQLKSVADAASASALSFPILLWIIQSFALEHVKGESASGWLSRAMEQQDSGLSDVFGAIDVATLAYPTADVDKLHRLAQLNMDELNADYVRDIEKMRKLVLSKLKERKPQTGHQVTMRLRFAVNAINQGRVIEIPSIWEAFVTKQCSEAHTSALGLFRTMMGAQEGAKATPLTPDELMKALTDAKNRAVALFDESLNGLSVNPSLRETLLTSLEEMATNTAESAKARMRDFLKKTAHQLLSKSELNKIPANVARPSADLEAQLASIVKKTMAIWHKETSAYGSSSLVKAGDPLWVQVHTGSLQEDEGQILQRAQDLQAANLVRENRIALSKLADDAEDQSIREFDKSTVLGQEALGLLQCRKETELQNLLDHHGKITTSVFQERMNLYNKESDYSKRLNSFLHSLDLSQNARRAENTDCIWRKCLAEVVVPLDFMESRLRSLNLPQTEATLNSSIDQIHVETKELLRRQLGEFLESPFCDIKERTDQLIKNAVQRNVEAVASFFTEPLRRAKAHGERINVTAFTDVRSSLRLLALELIDNHHRAQSHKTSSVTKQLSRELLESAVEHWLNQDVATLIERKNADWWLWWKLCLAAIILGPSLMYAIFRHYSRRSISPRSIGPSST